MSLRVLVVCISLAQEGLFVPLIYANLRSWADQFQDLKEKVEWLDPVILPDMPLPPGADVLAVSLYEWNSRFSYTLCETYRRENPGCFIAVGGPDAAFETSRGCPYGCTYCDWGCSLASPLIFVINRMLPFRQVSRIKDRNSAAGPERSFL